ncbi:chaperone modulator CbpM [Rhodoferax fermentans]|uniref:MerR family transcriptional regulator n=1 Tax=Rhodoferax fermentans TaxID=28066 RepID=A0A1T1AWP2_RHOFE|nr:chaperone modulator CbpM [Rhodoferax fermentans]MBK1685636.1 hypothetical protein [Rhodoferax fermentans]OOV08375.1 hypothetical protein RF819_18175 [Rhodoferax fermentans]
MSHEQSLLWSWTDSQDTVSLRELSHCCGLTEDELDDLVAYRALKPVSPATPERVFSAQWVMPLRNAARLRVDYDLDMFTVAILLDKLTRIEMLQRQVQSLQARLPAHLQSDLGA